MKAQFYGTESMHKIYTRVAGGPNQISAIYHENEGHRRNMKSVALNTPQPVVNDGLKYQPQILTFTLVGERSTLMDIPHFAFFISRNDFFFNLAKSEDNPGSDLNE